MKFPKLSDIITNVSCKYGAPMGRPNKGQQPITIISGNSGKIYKKDQVKVYERQVKLIEGYDNGGAYWGIGKPLMVRFTKDLSYIEFYRA